MSVDVRIREAITKAVREAGQPKKLTTKLIAWIEAIAAGNASLEDRDSVAKHVELLYEAVDVGELSEAGGSNGD